jgi:proteasome assembly chaperone (PAC2) family protein
MCSGSSARWRASGPPGRARGRAAAVPTIAHVIYIPGVLLVGIAIGFVLGARAARAEIERRRKVQKR